MIKQFFCKLWRGHDKRLLYECDKWGIKAPIEWCNDHAAWICVKCSKTGIDNVKPPKKYNAHESNTPRLNIIRFNKNEL